MENRTPVMSDTQMDLHPDPMVVPTLATFKTWGDCKSFAQDYKLFIEFMLSDPLVDPLDFNIIY